MKIQGLSPPFQTELQTLIHNELRNIGVISMIEALMQSIEGTLAEAFNMGFLGRKYWNQRHTILLPGDDPDEHDPSQNL